MRQKVRPIQEALEKLGHKVVKARDGGRQAASVYLNGKVLEANNDILRAFHKEVKRRMRETREMLSIRFQNGYELNSADGTVANVGYPAWWLRSAGYGASNDGASAQIPPAQVAKLMDKLAYFQKQADGMLEPLSTATTRTSASVEVLAPASLEKEVHHSEDGKQDEKALLALVDDWGRNFYNWIGRVWQKLTGNVKENVLRLEEELVAFEHVYA